MSIFYKSLRVGRNGKSFWMYKFRTLRENFSGQFATEEGYTRFGKFLRKTKLDELPQLWNVIKGDLRFFGYRAEEQRTIDLMPDGMRETLLKEKPGIIDLASVYFIDEEEILKKSPDPFETYWRDIRPMKFVLQCFYMENRSWLLNLAIMWLYFKKSFRRLWKN